MQIRFDSFSAPLKLLGCFAKNIKEFSSDYVNLEATIQTDMDSEFPPLCPPSVQLSMDSFIFCSSEIFRYLRDMALGIPLSQSKPLLRPLKSASLNSPTVAQSSTPLLSHNHTIDGQPRKFFSGYLIHPGAILCIMDLLPAVDYDLVMTQRGRGNTGGDHSVVMDCPNIVINDDCEDDDMNSDIGKKVIKRIK